ncbi:MAG: HYExAFE family protein [Phycisphaerae bacterium]|nr:HYExAFE family protein [Phycisphaerae bacterium]
MTRRHIHYEAAFEDYLRSRGIAYVPVDEQKKVIFSGARIKSFDFLVYRPEVKWLVDVKGRKFPYDTTANRRTWENWVTCDDLNGLEQWEATFGEGFCAMFVFAYWLTGKPDTRLTCHIHPFRDESYAFMCISLADYKAHAKRRSPKWETLTVPTADFRRLAKPIQEL